MLSVAMEKIKKEVSLVQKMIWLLQISSIRMDPKFSYFRNEKIHNYGSSLRVFPLHISFDLL